MGFILNDLQHSIPNEYRSSINHSKGVSAKKTPNVSHNSEAIDCDTNDNDHYDKPDQNENIMEGTIGDIEEYEYADQEEYWEPASQERELKLQLTKLIGTSAIKQEALE